MNILTKKRSSLTGSTPHRQTTTHENSNSAVFSLPPVSFVDSPSSERDATTQTIARQTTTPLSCHHRYRHRPRDLPPLPPGLTATAARTYRNYRRRCHRHCWNRRRFTGGAFRRRWGTDFSIPAPQICHNTVAVKPTHGRMNALTLNPLSPTSQQLARWHR